MHHLTFGSLAGLIATIPMTVFMRSTHRHLPWSQRYPLPPAQITTKAARSVGLDSDRQPRSWEVKTYVTHFAFGAAAGVLYALFQGDRTPPKPQAMARGCIYGTLVWSTSYLGWLPAAGIIRSATKEPWRRNALMLGAHWIWGSVLAIVLREITRPSNRSSKQSPPLQRRPAKRTASPQAAPRVIPNC